MKLSTKELEQMREFRPPAPWLPENSYPGVKWPGREAHHSPAPSAEVKCVVMLPLPPPMTFHGVGIFTSGFYQPITEI